MKKELEDKLKADYPELYSGLGEFQCADGWYGLLKILSETISFQVASLPIELHNQIKAVQIKEKFGTLRYYISHSTPYIDGAISVAEGMSSIICEFCGEVGSIRNVKGYYFTSCQKHFEEKLEKRK